MVYKKGIFEKLDFIFHMYTVLLIINQDMCFGNYGFSIGCKVMYYNSDLLKICLNGFSITLLLLVAWVNKYNLSPFIRPLTLSLVRVTS